MSLLSISIAYRQIYYRKGRHVHVVVPAGWENADKTFGIQKYTSLRERKFGVES